MTHSAPHKIADDKDTKGRHYYALLHPYGADTTYGDPEAPRYGRLHAFPSKSARDEWVRQGPDFRSENGARTAIDSDHTEVRRYYRAKQKGLRHTVGVEVRFHPEGRDAPRVKYF